MHVLQAKNYFTRIKLHLIEFNKKKDETYSRKHLGIETLRFASHVPKGRQNKKHCFLAMIPEGGQTKKH